MVRLGAVLGPVITVLWVFCVVDVILTRPGDTRNLGKYVWLAIVLLLPLVGSVAWLVAGRPRKDRPRAHERPAPGFPEYDRPGRAAGASGESDEEFLRRCRERAEEQRRRHQEQRDAEPPPDEAPEATPG